MNIRQRFRRCAVAGLGCCLVLSLYGCPPAELRPAGGGGGGGGGGGPFTFTASNYSVNIPQNTLSPEIDFTITPVGTFSGPVVIHWDATGDCNPSPNTNDVTIQVVQGAASVFKRKMYRWSATGRKITFIATHAATSTVRSVEIDLTH